MNPASYTTNPQPPPSLLMSDDDSIGALNRVLIDPYLQERLSRHTCTLAAQYTPVPEDIWTYEDDGRPMYRLDGVIARNLWSAVTDLKDYLVAAATGYTTSAAQYRPMEHNIPLRTLVSLSNPLPLIMHAPFAVEANPLLGTFDTPTAIWDLVELTRVLVLSAIRWISSAITECIMRDLEPEWDWGAQLGISRLEFYERIGVPFARAKLDRAINMHRDRIEVYDDAVVLHPTKSTVARAFAIGSVVKYQGGMLPLPPVEDDQSNEIFTSFLDKVIVEDD